MRACADHQFVGFSWAPLSTFEVVAAACPQKEDPIATDRPDTTNSSRVVPQGSFQSENGITLSQRDAGRVVDGTKSRLRTGVAPCFEILLDLPTYFAAVGGKPKSGLMRQLTFSVLDTRSESMAYFDSQRVPRMYRMDGSTKRVRRGGAHVGFDAATPAPEGAHKTPG